MAASPSPAQRGLTFAGRYAVVKKLGAGGVGTVYLVDDIVEGRRVAFKLIDIARLGAGAIESIQEEFKALASLRHPQLAEAYDFGFTDERRAAFYTREYVEGEPFLPGPPPAGTDARTHLRPLFDLLDALSYLHLHDILHLDIHPANLIEAADRRRGCVLIDFGMRRSLRGAGTPRLIEHAAVLPPEMLSGATLTPATDLHAVGRLLLHRVMGQAPQISAWPRELPGWGQRLVLDLERIAGKCLQADPARRFQTAEELRDALARVLGKKKAPRRRAVEPRALIVGREAHIEAVDGALREAAAGRARLLWFTAPAGFGKSLLLAEARQRAQLCGLEVITLRFAPRSMAGPSLVQALRAATEGAGGGSWLDALSPEHGGSTRERAIRAAERCFAEAADPLALLLDDVENADRESLLLVEALLRGCLEKASQTARGMAIILAGEKAPRMEALAGGLRDATRVLKSLKRADARRLVVSVLRPIEAPAAVVEALVRVGRGVPLELRRAAQSARARAQQGGGLPEAAALEEELRAGSSGRVPDLAGDPLDRAVAQAIAVLDRPVAVAEVMQAVGLPAAIVRAAIRRLEAIDVVSRHEEGRLRLYAIGTQPVQASLSAGAPRGVVRRIHSRLIAFLRESPASDLVARRHLVRHLIANGRAGEGRTEALRVSEALRDRSRPLEAVHVLAEATGRERSPLWRLRFAEAMSALLEEAGDHQEGIAVLEPVHAKLGSRLDARSRTRICRRLGIHYHRAGEVEKALDLFARVRRTADPRRDAEELIIVESELAELHTLRGGYHEAEAACRRGLDLLSRAREASEEFRGSMQVMLRASLGHLELRRMRLERASEELRAAASLGRRFGTATTRARILNNLGIVHNQLNQFAAARRCYWQSRRLHERSSDRRGVVLSTCNLATIAAKIGDAATARAEISVAARSVSSLPDSRLEFFVDLARGMVAHSLGEIPEAVTAFRAAITTGKDLEDRQFVAFAEVYLAESLIGCARYAEARERLSSLAGRAAAIGVPVLPRMVESRLLLVEALLGHPGARSPGASGPRTGMELLEAWNDVFIAAGKLILGEPCAAELDGARAAFERVGIPAGSRMVRVLDLWQALRAGDLLQVRALAQEIEPRPEGEHRLLAVLEPVARAAAYLALGALDSAAECLNTAESAIVGHPLLELDWMIEYSRAQLARRRGEREESRLHVHRSLHARDLITRSLPAKLRKSFLSHHRFEGLQAVETAMSAPQPFSRAEEAERADAERFGIVARSPRMRAVLETLLRLRDTEIPVLVTGETGTGKELVARAIYQSSPRRAGPFFTLHSASLPAELFESELFGHEAGAFTGAYAARAGLLEHVQHGTLFLDEVSSLPLAAQAKLLRVLDSGVVRRLGAMDPRPVDVRLIAATSEDLEVRIAEGSFRRDLYHRLAAVRIEVPALRDRKEDIPELTRRLLELHARRLKLPAPRHVLEDAMPILENHSWPGNVRQLETALVRLIVLGGSPGSAAEIVQGLLERPPASTVFEEKAVRGKDLRELHRELDKVYLTWLFKDTEGELSRMARRLGMKLSNLYYLLKRAGLNVRELRKAKP